FFPVRPRPVLKRLRRIKSGSAQAPTFVGGASHKMVPPPCRRVNDRINPSVKVSVPPLSRHDLEKNLAQLVGLKWPGQGFVSARRPCLSQVSLAVSGHRDDREVVEFPVPLHLPNQVCRHCF